MSRNRILWHLYKVIGLKLNYQGIGCLTSNYYYERV